MLTLWLQYDLPSLTLGAPAPEVYGSRSLCVCVCVCVCLSVCYHIFGDVLHLYVTKTIAISFARYSLDFYKRYSL